MQRIREAEQGAIFEEYSDKEYEVLTAIVQRVEKNGVYVELGKTDGIIPFNEVIVGERPHQGLCSENTARHERPADYRFKDASRPCKAAV